MQPAIDHGIRVIRELGKKMFSFEHLSKNVESGLYAATVKGILLYHINVTKRVVSYGNLATATQGLPKGGQLAQALERIAEDDHLNKRPLSTAVVVNEKTGMPGAGFFNQCRGLGHPVPKTPEAELLFWKQLLTHLDVLPFMGETAVISRSGDSLDPALLRKAAGDLDIHAVGEVGILENMWRAPDNPNYVDQQPVPDISLHPEIKGYREKAAAQARERAVPKRAYPHILIEKQEDRVVGTVGPFGMGVHRTPPEHQFKNNPASCAHANENPNVCKCHETCYCKTRTCRTKADENLVAALMDEALPREKELGQQVDEEEAAEQMSKLEPKAILASTLKEGDVLNLMRAGFLKPVKVAKVTTKTVLKHQGDKNLEVQWTDTEGNSFECSAATHLIVMVPPMPETPTLEVPSSKLP